MPNAPTQSYHTAPLFYKILAWLTLVGLGFVAFHFFMVELADNTAENWVREIYMTLLFGLPFFLFLTGSSLHDRKLRIPVLFFFAVFVAGYIMTQLNFYGIIDVNYVNYWMVPALGGLLLSYMVHFVLKKKITLLDVLKFAWLIAVCWAYGGARVPWGKYAYQAFMVSICIFPLLMGTGLFVFFRKPRSSSPKRKH